MDGYIFALVASMLWGLNAVFVRKALEKTDAFSGTFFIVLVSAVCLLMMSIFDKSLFNANLTQKNLIFLAAGGILQYFFGRSLTYFSAKIVGSSRAFTGSSTRIMFSAILGILILGEKVSFMKAFGIIAMIAGMYILSMERLSGLHISIAGGFFYGLASIVIKAGMAESVVLSNLISILSALPFLALLASRNINTSKFNRFLLFSGFTLFLATLSYYKALSLAPVVVVVPLSNLYPVFAVIFSYLFIQSLERIGLRTFAGACIAVFGGIIVYLS
ncbi:putative membrane protein [Archaeoglobus sulfaticallidus PM70-1]|uniref:Putative membrane protein n=1 Tax=Archaeoglobus sulfaticallidus PM70-1 TaxID=387631 RepID=N0BC45_9EURY|nr:DMT family transporter [Archaeoglobus sulfaticallidus]AGK61194.1 putative membrane protein [Archaeoglobus sulfaticallidus PM70-1]